jgi:hypothetical protein
MAKAGGIVALIAGIFSVIAAGFTLSVGGIGRAVNAENAQSVVLLGWGGVLFSFLVIVLGAMAMGRPTRKLGWWLIVCSILGALLGGTLVAIFMLLSLVGGVLVLNGDKTSSAAVLSPAPSAKSVRSNNGSVKVAEIARLSKLRSEGKITDVEFSRLKSQLLDGKVPSATPVVTPSASASSSQSAAQMSFTDIPKIEKMKVDGLLSADECSRLIGGVVSRSQDNLSIDDLPALASLYTNGALTAEQFASAKSSIIDRSTKGDTAVS